MKTFKDLVFNDHPNSTGKQAVMMFPNGYGISVVRFTIMGRYGSYTDNETEWEAAVLKGKGNEWFLCYDTEITEDVIGHLSNDGVTKLMQKIQEL